MKNLFKNYLNIHICIIFVPPIAGAMYHFFCSHDVMVLSEGYDKESLETLHDSVHMDCFLHYIGIYGLSNARLDSPWRKLLYGKEKFTSIVKTPNISKNQLTESLLDLLGDKTW